MIAIETKEPLNLYQKLHRIQETVNGIKKDKESFSFSYTTGEKILSYIKPLMNDLKLLLIPSITDMETERQDYIVKEKEKSENTVKLKMVMTWIDVDSGEKLPVPWGGIGQNDWDKGFGSALTYSERYFLLKFFHISTDNDDIDNLEIKRKLEESLEDARNENELNEIWSKLDRSQQQRNKKKFSERKQLLLLKSKPKSDVREGL